METAYNIEAWLRDHTPEVLRNRVRIWSEGRPETQRRYWWVRLGPHRLYLGARPELRDRILNYAVEIRKFYFGSDATLREIIPAWSAEVKCRPSWKKLRDQVLSERGAYFKGGRIRRRRAQRNQLPG
jgi:hypothetical protein